MASVWWVWAYVHFRAAVGVPAATTGERGYRVWSYGHLAYTDLISLWYVHHLSDHAAPYVHTPIQYPVVTGLFMWVAAWFPGLGGYFAASSLGLLACLVACVWLLHRSSPRHAWVLACSPLLMVFTLVNWDLLAIALMLGGHELYRRRRYGWSGALFSLAVFAKFFPVVLAGYCVLALWRDRADPAKARGLKAMIATAAGVGAAVNVPFAVAGFRGWADFFTFNAARTGDGGVFGVLHLDTGWTVARVDELTLAVVATTGIVLAWRVARGMRPEVAAGLAFGVFMLVNKTYSPQYDLWIYVYALLADWPLWSLAALAVTGLVDYVNAISVLHLLATRVPGHSWYTTWVYPLVRALQLVAVAAGVAASLSTALLRRQAGDTPGAAGARSPGVEQAV